MAVQQLTQPILNPIVAFDATKVSTINFIVIGGAQVIGNRLVISDNQTGQEIYNQVQSTMKLEHNIPANTLENGGYYNAIIYTIDSGGNESVASKAIPFYCYSQPVLTIDNIPATETIENGTYAFTGSYLQQENEVLNSYQYILYDSNRNVLTQSDLIYYEADNSLSYTFVGMSNDTSYYVELTGQTINGTKITSGLRYFTVRYLQPASFAICDLVNNCENGYIQISSNIVAIDGQSNPEPPIYIDDKEVDLRDPNSWVEWNEGFNIQNDFTMRVWGRDFNPYEEIITLTNDLNSDTKPNKIVLKWMIGDVIKNLPDYTNINGFNINVQNSQNGIIENLMIGGNSVQKTSDSELITKSIQPMSFETQFSKQISILPDGVSTQNVIEGEDGTTIEGESIEVSDLDTTKEDTLTVYGNSVQETRSGYNLANLDAESYTKVGLTITNNGDGSFTLNGTTTGSGDIILTQNTDINKSIYNFENTSYLLKTFVKSGSFSNPDNNIIQTACVGKIGEQTSYGMFLNTLYNNTFATTAIANTDWKLSRIEIYVSGAGITFNNYTIQVLLAKSNDKNLPFEQYGVMPSPEYPSEIQNVEGNVDITVCNKNILPQFDETTKIQTSHGVTITKNDDGTYTLNGTSTGTVDLILFGSWANKNPIWKVKKGNIYFKANSSKIDGFMSLVNIAETSTTIQIQANSYWNNQTVEEVQYAFIRLCKNSGVTFNNEKIILELAYDEIEEVELHQQQTITFPLAEGQKLMKGDYLAKDGIHHVRKQVELVGTENWILSGATKNNQYIYQIPDIKIIGETSKGNLLSNYFEEITGVEGYNSNVINGISGWSLAQIRISLDISIVNRNVTEFKQWLAQQKEAGIPVIVEYELENEVIEPYTAEQQEAYNQINSLVSYEGYNLITNESNAILNLHYNYVTASPSPTRPSQIQNIGDNINLFNIQEYIDFYSLTVTGNDDGHDYVAYTTKAYENIKFMQGQFKENTQYTLSFYGRQKTTSTQGVTTGFRFYYTDGTYTEKYVDNNEIWTKYTITTNKNKTIDYIIMLWAYGGTIWLSDIKLEEGTKPSSYSPYNCGNTDITICNKNLLKLYEYNSSITANGVTITINEDGTIKLNGTATSQSYIEVVENFKSGISLSNTKELPLDINKKYIFSVKKKSGTYTASNFTFALQPTLAGTKNVVIYINRQSNAEITGSDGIYRGWIAFPAGSVFNELVLEPQIEEGEIETEYVIHKQQQTVFPLQEGQKLYKGSYLAKDGIHHKRKQFEVDGTNLKVNDVIKYTNGLYYCKVSIPFTSIDFSDGYSTHFKWVKSGVAIGNCYVTGAGKGLVFILEDQNITTVEGANNWLIQQKQAGTPAIFECELAEEETEAYTEEQQEAYNKLTNISSYSGENNVYSLINLPIPITVVTSIIPSPNNPSKIYSLGDRVNLINLNDFNITYNQQYSEDTNTNFILYPNYIYTLSFDYNVNNTTTDLYFSVGYGKDSYENDISSESQYLNLYSGRNTVSFIVPDTINDGDFLWIKFAQTIILADVDVEISNIQLEKGFFATDYKSPNIYTIYPTSVQKNLYNYKTPIYIINNNTQYTDIQNGYSITLKKDNIDSSFAIGYKGILNANDTYAISYNYTGNLENFKLYITDKESQTPIDEISLNNGVFQAPEGIYDLQLVFNIDSSSINNYLELWNIQIEANDTISEYEPYNSKELTFDTEEQLLSAGNNVRDLVALKSPNILNSKTQSGTTIPSTKYYLNQAGNTEYHIWYYNNEGNLIVFIDPDGHEASGVVGIRGAFTVHSECTKVTITKSSDPDANDVSQEEIESNQIIISKGDSPIEYYPYFDVPSRVQKVAKKIFNGTEIWTISATEDMPYIYVSDIKPSTMNAICTDYRISDRFKLSDGLFGVSSSKNIIFYNSNYVNKLDEWKTYLTERYNNNNPIVLEYELNTPIVTPLTQDEIDGLNGLLSYDGITNIYTNNNILGYNTFNYISSYSEQQTQNAYLQLKCYNANTLYYFIHSNYIEIPEDTSKVFIWLRRKNNLFDLKIEDLGDYKEEDHPTDITKPVVTLDINLNDITQSEIPVTATCIDETGLRTVRFSKDNGISWDEVIPVDGLSTNNSYVFKNLSADTFYTIRVEAIDLSGNIGGMSQRVTTKA